MARVSAAEARARRAAVLDAATAELAAVGPQRMALTTVAERCAATTSAVYGRFPTKDLLLEAVVGERLEPAVGGWFDRCTTGAGTVGTGRRAGRTGPPELEAWHQLVAGAAFAPALQPAVEGFLCRRPALTAGTGADHPAHLWLLAWHLGAWIAQRGLGLTRVPRSVADALHLRAAGLVAVGDPLGTRRRPSGDRSIRRSPPAAAPAPVDTGAGPPPTSPLDDLGARLLAAAAQQIAAHGVAAASVATIARAAGTTTGAVYNRFSGKAGLVAEAMATSPSPTFAGAGAGPLPPDRHTDDAGTAALWSEAMRTADQDGELAVAVRHRVASEVQRRARHLAALQQAGGVRTDVAPSRLALVLFAAALGGDLLVRAGAAAPDAVAAAHRSVRTVVLLAVAPDPH
jgi:AcrR family transcriptional regulator